MMNRVQYAAFGPAAGFELTEVDDPMASDGHLVVDVCVAALNPLDFKVSSGRIPMMTGPGFPKGFGTDIAGVVTQVGSGTDGFAVGDRVFGSIPVRVSGAFAERAAIPAVNAARLPAELGFEEGAALAIVGSAAVQALSDTAGIGVGTRVLINGAAGGVGSVAVQVAKQLGAVVTATASGQGLDAVAALGADEIIDYTTTDIASLGKRFDAVFDTVSTLSRADADNLIVGNGHHINLNPGPPVTDDFPSLFTAQLTQMTAERLARVAALAAAGKIRAEIGHRFTLDEAVDTLASIESGTTRHTGKAVMTVSP
jgi:NADPH:quinone reductase-like Zn-dependent oxidoreductase